MQPEDRALAQKALSEAEATVVEGLERQDVGAVVSGFGSWLSTAMMWPGAVDEIQAARTCKLVGHGLAMCRMPEARRAVYQLGADYGPADSLETLYCLANSAAQLIDRNQYDRALALLQDIQQHPMYDQAPLLAQYQMKANYVEALGSVGDIDGVRHISDFAATIDDPLGRMMLDIGVLHGWVLAEQWDEAAATSAFSFDLEKTIELGPEVPLLVSWLRAQTHAAFRDWPAVVHACEFALDRWHGADDTRSLRLLECLGDAREALGDFRGALEAWKLTADVVQRAEAYRSDVFDALLAATMRAHAVAAGGGQAENEAQSRLLNQVAHELRTPMTAIMGFTELLLEDSALEEEAREHLSLIEAEGSASLDLIEDLLTVGHARTARLVLTARPVDALAEAKELVARIEHLIPGVEVSGSGMVIADPSRLRQVIRNLLTNADRYGGDRRGVAISSDGRHTIIDVWDNGEPLSIDVRTSLFTPYAGSDRTDSLGLGLDLARTLARAMGGDLTYRHDGSAAHFEMRLPAPNTLG